MYGGVLFAATTKILLKSAILTL